MRTSSLLFLSGWLTLSLAACAGPRTPEAQRPGPTETGTPGSSAMAPGAAATVQAPAGSGRTFTGRIAERMDAGEYTYARLQGASQDIWIAAQRFEGAVGTPATVALDLPMEQFESKTLNRTFPLLYFVSTVALNGAPLGGPVAGGVPMLMSGHGSPAPGGHPARGDVPVSPVTPPPGGLTVADVITKATALSGTAVTVRGTVVKFNAGILDRNWLHLRDGSGSEGAGTHDLTITTLDTAEVGAVVTVTGTVGTKKDFGAGYSYDAIVEHARLSRP